MNTTILAGMLGYVLVQFLIGAWVSRRMTSEQDYILAGRSLGPTLVAFSVFATWFGAEAIVASAGEIYDKGLAGAITDPFGYGLAVVIVALLLAAPLRRRGMTTYADMIRERYSGTVEKLFVLVLLPGSLFWAAAQIRAFGQIMASSTGMDIGTALLIAAVLVAAYSVVGGLLADAITDVVQGLAVIIGLGVLVYFVAQAIGGVDAGLAKVPATRLDPLVTGDDGLLGKVEKLAVVIGGSIVSVELISRFLGARSVSVARFGTLAGGLMYLVIGLMPVFLGLVGPLLIKDLAEPEQIVPKLAEAHLPPLGYALFLGALVSAILSVVHAALHAPAAQISHNIIGRLSPDLSPKARLLAVRLTVLVLSVVAYGLAMGVERIKELVEIASAFGSAGAFVVAMFALFTRFGGPASAATSLIAGILMWVWAKYLFGLKAPYLIGLGSAFLVYVVVGIMESRDRAAPQA
ncbi:MAG: sodium:solute symporter family protein [Hyphomicrobiaceae bacterium]